MMKVTFDEGSKTIEIPRSWSDIRLGNYEKWFDREPKTRQEQVQYIADICNIEPAVLLESPAQIFNIIVETVSFIFDEQASDPSNSVTIDGTDYSIAFSDELTLAEWVDIEAVFENENDSKLSEILSILCRPAGETYDAKRSESRRSLFGGLTMDKAMPLLAFFLLRSKESEKISSLCSQVREQASLYLDHIRDFAENGGGTKSLPIWQKIKLYYLTKYLQNRLSKFSDSSSTKSTKIRRKKNRKGFRNKFTDKL